MLDYLNGRLFPRIFSIDVITNILSSSQSTSDKAASIRSYLNSHHEVTGLDLRFINIDAECGQAIAEGLIDTNVTSLSLWGNDISVDGTKALAQGLKNTNVTNLNLGANHIGFYGAKALAIGLKCTKLTNLSLPYNRLGGKGARALAGCLKDMNVTNLNLRGNDIGDEGALALAEFLKDTNVISLDLSGNNIGDQGALALAELLKDSNVTSLSLWLNNIGDTGAKALAEFLKDSNVTTLNLDENPSISRGNKQKLDAIITANRERIANQRSSALVLIRQHSQNQAQGVSTLSDDVLRFPESGSQQELEYMTGIMLDGRLPEELFYRILSYVPSLVLPACRSGSNGPISILDRLYEINTRCSERLMMDEAPTQTPTSGFFGTLWGMLPSLPFHSQQQAPIEPMDIDYSDDDEPKPRKKKRFE